ncbi:MAG: hypothetical protein MUF27_03310 [Acidobacteria bacterium]|jgi:hypothetical protein|nr:hypothetical protein [Acidobacteriota bacterium]
MKHTTIEVRPLSIVLRRRCLADLRKQLEVHVRAFVYRPTPPTGLAGTLPIVLPDDAPADVRRALDALADAVSGVILGADRKVKLHHRYAVAVRREAHELAGTAFAIESDAREVEPMGEFLRQNREAARRLGRLRTSTTGRRSTLPTDDTLRALVAALEAWVPTAPSGAQAAVAALERGILADYPRTRAEHRVTLTGKLGTALASRATPAGKARRIIGAWFGVDLRRVPNPAK